MGSRGAAWCLVVGLVVVPAARAQDGPDAVKRELDRQQGTWAVVSSIRDGKEADAEIRAGIRRVVAGDHVVWTRAGKPFAGTTLVLDPATEPKSLDVVPDGGPARGEHVLGIYRWDGDRLVLCMADAGRPRPKDFTAEPGSRQTLRVFAKVEEEPAEGRSRGRGR